MKRTLDEDSLDAKKIKTTTNSSEPIMLKSNQEGIDMLVPDNWAHIFTFLDPIRDLLPNVMSVCKLFNHVLGGNDDSDSICKSLIYQRVSIGTKNGFPASTFLKVRPFDINYLNRLLGYIIRVSPKNSCKLLHLGRDHENNDILTIEFSIDFFKRSIESGVFDGLKELRLSTSINVFLRDGQALSVFKEWISRLKDLEKLYFSSLFPADVYDCIFRNCLNLRDLKVDLGGYELQDSLPVLEKLESFEFASINESFSPSTLISFFRHTPNLRKLTLGYSYLYTNDIFLGLAENCKNLSELTFGERYLHESNNVPIITNQLTNLETLVFIDGVPFVDHLMELEKLTKLKKFVFNLDEFSEGGDDICELFNKIGGNLVWANTIYITTTPENAEGVVEEEADEEDDDKNQEHNFIELANKKFPNLQTLEIFDSDLEGVTIDQLFQEIPNLKEVKLDLCIEGCSKVFESIEEDTKVRKAASLRLLELFGEKNPTTIDLFDNRIFYHKIVGSQDSKKVKVRIYDIDYDNIVKFKIKLV